MRPRIRQDLLGTLCALLACMLVACEPTPATGVLVVVDSDIEVPSTLSRVRVRVLKSDGTQFADGPLERTVKVGESGEAQHPLPFSLGIVPEHLKGKTSFQVVITGMRDGTEVVEQKAIVAFRPNVTLRLEMFLASTCQHKLCRDATDKTCNPETSACEATPVLTSLPKADAHDKLGGYVATNPFDASAPETDVDSGPQSIDAGPRLDSGPLLDAGPLMDSSHEPEAGPIADAKIDAEAGPGCDAQANCSCKTGEEPSPEGGCRAADDCLNNQCKNGSSCRDGVASYTCDCGATGCTGQYCETCPTPCAGVMCLNGGVCAAGTCNCAGTGFDGTRCEHNIDDCPGNACTNGSACKDGVKAYTCECGASGGCGQYCAPCATSCTGVTCAHGSCVNGACDCGVTGYVGQLCETATACVNASVCSPSYPCTAASAADYSCRGQFADWPMPDRGNKVQPQYETTADVVRDKVTGLMWERVIVTGEDHRITWQKARARCAATTTGGFSGWRLPTKIELESIVDFTAYQPAFDAVAFPDTPSGTVFWTDSPMADPTLSDRGWMVASTAGEAQVQLLSTPGYVRCVRGP